MSTQLYEAGAVWQIHHYHHHHHHHHHQKCFLFLLGSLPCHDVTFPLLTYKHHGKDCVHFSTGFIQKKPLSIPASGRIFIRKSDEISRALRLMHDGISLDKILPKQVGYFETRIN
jgi:hypothetical protein